VQKTVGRSGFSDGFWVDGAGEKVKKSEGKELRGFKGI